MRTFFPMRVIAVVAVVSVSGMIFAPAHAQHHGGGGNNDGPHLSPHMHMDGHFSHNHPYYDHGYSVRGAPHGGYEIHHGGQLYFYDRNHWYRRHGGISIVIGAPIGAFVALLPFYYTTLW